MRDNDIDKLLIAAAHMKGLEVIIAKHRLAFQLPGIHIMNPTYDQVMEAIAKALGLDLKKVICYTKPLD